MGKKKGVLCHITSLPNKNIKDAKKFISLLSKNNINAWQMLPITPPDLHGSPYASTSAFAGWTNLTDEKKCAKMDDESHSGSCKDWMLVFRFRFSLSQNIVHHLAMHIGEAIAATLEFVSKSLVIDAQ